MEALEYNVTYLSNRVYYIVLDTFSIDRIE